MSASRRWPISNQRPGSLLVGGVGWESPLGEHAVVGFSPVGSKLALYHPGSIVATNHDNNNAAITTHFAANKSNAVRKIRNDISNEERQEILMAFELFNARKIGKLNYRELKVAMKAPEFHVKKEDVRKIIQEQTKGRNDGIDQDDFMEILTKNKYKEKDPEEDLVKAFRYFNKDGDGEINESEFFGIMKRRS